ncbi:MAG: aminotransferase class III-fold pyridoxal phosphate-dependent enzyme, partial [Elusimicrobiota bacterium]
YTANPLACAAAIANLDVFTKEKTIRTLPAKIRRLSRELATLNDLPWVGDIRQRGLMVGIELVKDKKTQADFPVKEKVGARMCAAFRPRGLLIRPLGNTLVLMPPLSITEDEIADMVRVIRSVIVDAYNAQSTHV